MEVKCVPGNNCLLGSVIFDRDKCSLSVWFGDFTVTAHLDQKQTIVLGRSMALLPDTADYIIAPTSIGIEKFTVTNQETQNGKPNGI